MAPLRARRQRFRKREMRRAIEATRAAGLEVQSIEIDQDGKIRIIVADKTGNATAAMNGNPWDQATKELLR